MSHKSSKIGKGCLAGVGRGVKVGGMIGLKGELAF